MSTQFECLGETVNEAWSHSHAEEGQETPVCVGLPAIGVLFLQTRPSRFRSTLMQRKLPVLPFRGIRSLLTTPSVEPVLVFLSDLPSSRLKGFPPPATSREPRRVADSSPGNSSGVEEGFGACSVPRAGFLLRVAGLLSHRLAGCGGASPRERVCARCLRLPGRADPEQ